MTLNSKIYYPLRQASLSAPSQADKIAVTHNTCRAEGSQLKHGWLPGLLAAAEVGLPEETDFSTLPKGRLKRLLVLDGVQDPGNLGTLLRTAEALGWQGAFFLEGAHSASNNQTCSCSSYCLLLNC